MIQIKNLSLKNFMSFEDETITFKQGVPTAIQGINNTDEGQESNGSGKSAPQEVIYYLFVGTSIRKGIRSKDLIRNGCDESVISITLFETISKKETVITRTIKQKGSEIIAIKINGENQKDKYATVRDANRFILENVLQTTKEDIDNLYLINSEKYTSFIFAPDSKKKEEIARFSGADVAQGTEKYVQEDVDKLESELEEIKTQIVNLEADKRAQENLIEQFSIEEEKREREEHIHALKNKIDTLTLENKESVKIPDKNTSEMDVLNKNISEFEKELETIQKSIDKSNLDKIQKDVQETREIEQLISKQRDSIQDKLNTHLNNIEDLKNKIRGEIECPKCSHIFVPEKDVDVQEVKKKITIEASYKIKYDKEKLSKDSEIRETNEILSALNEQKQETQKKIDEIEQTVQEVKNEINNLKEQVQRKERESKRIQSLIKENEAEIKRLQAKIKEIESEEIKDPTKKYKAEIERINGEIEKVNIRVQEKKDGLYEVKQWIFNFKKFFSYLVNKSLKVIESRTNDYLKQMRSNLSIRIDGVKVLSDGSLRENITPNILKNGMVSGVAGKLSGGEKVRVDAAILIARQSIINEVHPAGGIDLLWVDEIFDKADGLGIKNLLHSFKELNKTILLTTHITHDFNVNTLKVVKDMGVSHIE